MHVVLSKYHNIECEINLLWLTDDKELFSLLGAHLLESAGFSSHRSLPSNADACFLSFFFFVHYFLEFTSWFKVDAHDF
jgi:hypothetical protein